jgi:hypothetical protein
LADETLRGFELSTVAPTSTVRRAYRLARLLDDLGAEEWLRFEVVGYPAGEALAADAWAAAVRSNRLVTSDDGGLRAQTSSVGELAARIQASLAQLSAAADAPVAITSANPSQFVFAPPGNMTERSGLRRQVSVDQGLLEKVLGAVFTYVSERHQELRFGAAVESAFEVVRVRVDHQIGIFVPDAQRKLAAALESATSANPEHWAAAAATCRRLLLAAADQLRPAGPDVDGRKMGPDNYVNRLMDWIAVQERSRTMRDLTTSELEHLGMRLDAVVDAGSKGAHAEVSRYDASRFITGTYLLLGDILRLAPEVAATAITDEATSVPSTLAPVSDPTESEGA